jgi:hypothetical protein
LGLSIKNWFKNYKSLKPMDLADEINKDSDEKQGKIKYVTIIVVLGEECIIFCVNGGNIGVVGALFCSYYYL